MAIDLEDLRESNEFLNLVLDNIDAAVLIADESLQVHQVNDAFRRLFDAAGEASGTFTFGEVSGCVNAVLENARCGATSHCAHCVLRRSLIETMLEDVPADRRPLDRVFYIDGRPVRKHLQLSTRRISYRGRDMFLLMIFDVTEIERQRRELQRKQRLLDRDLEAAAAIQASLLPDRSPRLKNLEAAWKFRPCEQIGGDIFNIQLLAGGRVGVYMLDVCGHGVPAALISVAASQFLHSDKGLQGSDCELSSPATVLENLHRAFPFERFDTFFTICCLTVDPASGRVTYACAGHPPPIVLRAGGGPEVLDAGGPMIGSGLTRSDYRERECRLLPGDKLLLYTDGLADVRDRFGRPWGRRRLVAALEAHRERTVRELVDAVWTEAATFWQGAVPDDDITILGLEYTGDGTENFAI